ncbi:intraflagellar transport complex B protein 46 C terminal-domain-containing protein, partial [Ochromonadaceae sp. CCMP2298]
MENSNSGEFSDELDEFEESVDEKKAKNLKNSTAYQNKPYDEAYEVSQDLSMAESFDGRGDKPQSKNDAKNDNPRERQLKNDKYDEAVEVSQSLDQTNLAPPKGRGGGGGEGMGRVGGHDMEDMKEAKGMTANNELSKSQAVLNRPFDEALEFSASGSDGSVDTRGSSPGHHRHQKSPDQEKASPQESAPARIAAVPQVIPQMSAAQRAAAAGLNTDSPPSKKGHRGEDTGEEESSEEEGEEGDVEESYDNLEGAYNPRDYAGLNVSVEVRDLFQYVERYKPHEVPLDTPFKCFIPEYIPAIGELDAFIKVPRPDGGEDGLGLRFLDEPSANQSDPTVLELQLRAKSKKLQYGDVAVRSIEHADKNPSKIEKWVQDIKDLHRSKPPPQV